MGYDVERFIGEISQEFICSICTMVLKEPMQSPCDHLFCKDCITQWLTKHKSCPVDRRSLTSDDFKTAVRFICNLLNELQIKCDFHGCEVVVRLEHLKNHITSCEYNPIGEIVCDGCNLKITRLEYREKNCATHLADRLRIYEEDKRILGEELKAQKERFECTIQRLKEKNTKLSDKNNYLSDRVSRYDDANKKLSIEIGNQKEHFERIVGRLEEEIKKLNDGTRHKEVNVANHKHVPKTFKVRSALPVPCKRHIGQSTHLKPKSSEPDVQRRKTLVKRRETERTHRCTIRPNCQSAHVSQGIIN